MLTEEELRVFQVACNYAGLSAVCQNVLSEHAAFKARALAAEGERDDADPGANNYVETDPIGCAVDAIQVALDLEPTATNRSRLSRALKLANAAKDDETARRAYAAQPVAIQKNALHVTKRNNARAPITCSCINGCKSSTCDKL